MYCDHYGLTGRPFQLTPDPRFWFESATHKKAMAYLGYGLAQGEGFIVITGEVGSGKTTLVGHLMATIDEARLNVVKIVSTQVGGDDMLRLAAQAFGLATEGVEKAQLLERIENHLADRTREGRQSLLIVDEAQNLGVPALEELRMLSNFQHGGRARLQIFLLGQPEFRERLASPELLQLRQRVIATHHLTGMEADETGDYIAHRLKLVGWTGNPDFTDAAVAAIHAHSDGIPRRINTLATRLLLAGAIENVTTIDAPLVRGVVADMEDDLAPAAQPVAESAPVAAQIEPAPVAKPAPPPMPEPIEEVASVMTHMPELAGSSGLSQRFISDAHTLDLAARVAMLETQVIEQEKAFRRMLTLLVDWAEGEESAPSLGQFNMKAG